MIQFMLNDEEEKRVVDWLEEVVYPKAVEYQKKKYKNKIKAKKVPAEILDHWDIDMPAFGSLTYRFHIGLLGTSLNVVYEVPGMSDFKIDLTEYDKW